MTYANTCRCKHGEVERHEEEFARLNKVLNYASERSTLPEEPAAEAALDDLFARIRMNRLTEMRGTTRSKFTI